LTEVAIAALVCPGCKTTTPAGRRYKIEKARRPVSRRDRILERLGVERDLRGRIQLTGWHGLVSALAVTAVVGFISFKITESMMIAAAPDRYSPQARAIRLVRDSPCGIESGRTIGQYLDRYTGARMAKGQVEEIEGWRIEETEDHRWLVIFSFEEIDTSHEAQWLVDLPARRVFAANEWAGKLLEKSQPT
jgi:hypothetical protein